MDYRPVDLKFGFNYAVFKGTNEELPDYAELFYDKEPIGFYMGEYSGKDSPCGKPGTEEIWNIYTNKKIGTVSELRTKLTTTGKPGQSTSQSTIDRLKNLPAPSWILPSTSPFTESYSKSARDDAGAEVSGGRRTIKRGNKKKKKVSMRKKRKRSLKIKKKRKRSLKIKKKRKKGSHFTKFKKKKLYK